jgi:YHS domain-containing protein
MAWEVWWALVLGFLLSAMVQAWAPRKPVCGMTVDRGGALSAERHGRRYFFCGPGCRSKFEAEPDRYAHT